MTVRVARTCTEIRDDRRSGESERPGGDSIEWQGWPGAHGSGAGSDGSHTLVDFRESHAYVLLGAPGAGKTTEFRYEAECTGGHHVTARDFLTFDDRPEWRGATLFIDGLDEIRAGSSDGRTPLDGIRRSLEILGRPRFRLSCREADWFGANDRIHLEMVSRDGHVKVLRLDSLSDDGMREILSRHAGIDSPEEFITAARERGIDSLLANPKNLEMLSDAVAGGTWPDTRMGAFELACEKLVRETNPEHRIANPNDPPASELLDAAGRVCALQLICGLKGAALVDAAADDNFPAPDRFGADSTALRRALPSRVFERTKYGQRSPVHRNVAEFLAARHLAGLIGDRTLSVRRVLALLTGEDAGVVTPLRGLAAWLAAHCPDARRELIERDPEGVAAYGDPSVLTREESRLLLERLRPLAHSLDARRFGLLATPRMVPVLRECLNHWRRDGEHRNLVDFLLRVLANAAPLPELREDVLDLAAGDEHSPGTKEWAAICLAEGALAQPDRFRDVVRQLLSGLHDGHIRDDGKGLLGRLLHFLYPIFIKPGEVFEFLDENRRDHDQTNQTFDAWKHFWRHDLAGKCQPEDAVVVLDMLVDIFERSEGWRLAGEPPDLIPTRAVGALVTKALCQAGDQDLRRTIRWLSLVGVDDEADSDDTRVICGWIEARPERYEALLREGVAQCLGSTDVDICMQRAKSALHAARVPSDYGKWCLSEMNRIADHPNLVRFWFAEAWGTLVDGHGADGLTLEQLEAVAASDGRLVEVFDDLRSCDIHGRQRARTTERRRERESARAERRRMFGRYEKALQANRCPARVLHTIAEAYWGHYLDVQAENGQGRLRQLLGDDTLVEAAIEGLRGAIHRNDLPAPAEVLGLRRDHRRHALALPVLAGLELDASNELTGFGVDQVQLAIAFLLAEWPRFPVPGWFEPLVDSRPDLVADEIVRFATMELRRGERYISFVHELSAYDWLSDVARLACPRLLNAFPVRAPGHLSQTLNRLLWCGIGHLEASVMESIVTRKLAAGSMTVTQRALWLGAHLVVSTQPGLESVERFARKHENAMSGFIAFFERPFIRRLLLDRLPSLWLGRLVRLLGPGRRPLGAIRSEPLKLRESDFVPIVMEALGNRVDEDAVSALADLASDTDLASWYATIRRVQREQRALRRDARYRHPDLDSARRSLEGGQPANAADQSSAASIRA